MCFSYFSSSLTYLLSVHFPLSYRFTTVVFLRSIHNLFIIERHVFVRYTRPWKNRSDARLWAHKKSVKAWIITFVKQSSCKCLLVLAISLYVSILTPLFSYLTIYQLAEVLHFESLVLQPVRMGERANMWHLSIALNHQKWRYLVCYVESLMRPNFAKG